MAGHGLAVLAGKYDPSTEEKWLNRKRLRNEWDRTIRKGKEYYNYIHVFERKGKVSKEKNGQYFLSKQTGVPHMKRECEELCGPAPQGNSHTGEDYFSNRKKKKTT